MRIYEGRALTIFRLRIGATSRSLACGLCRGSVRRQKNAKYEMNLPDVVLAMMSERIGKGPRMPLYYESRDLNVRPTRRINRARRIT
jgi:hypothetical protein